MAHSELVENLISRWIIEYECYELWKRFSDNLRTHQTWQALFVDHLSRANHLSVFRHLGLKQQDDLEQTSMLLIKLMNSISSASKLPPDNNMEIITPLEESLKYIDKLNDCKMKETVKALLQKLKRVIKQECVVICFRCYKLRLAKTIYERVWSSCTNLNSKESSTKSSLLNLFKDNVNIAVALESFPVSELSENCKKFFSKYFNLMVPFVIRNAEKLFETFPIDLGLVNKKKKVTSENSKSKHFLIQCWFADYFCYKAWKNMENIDSIKFDWLLKFVSENIDLETKSCLFIRFMFKFIERKNADESHNSYLSPLELCLELLDKAEKLHVHNHDGTEKALSALRQELKKHVVLMWCNKNMYDKAKNVFNKLFDNSTTETDVLRLELENILKGNKQFSLDESKLKQSVKSYFTIAFENDSHPYLLHVAESVVKKMKSRSTKTSAHPHEGGNMEARKRQRTTKKLPDDFISTDSIEEEASGKKKKDFFRSASFTHDGDDDEDMQEDNDDLDVENDESRNEKRRKSEKKKKAVWCEEEEELIYRGVLLYGVGNWYKIAKNMLTSRTKNEIKEKWRTMVKQGKMKKYVADFGPIPGYYIDTTNDNSMI